VSNVLSQGIGQLQGLQGWRSAVMLFYPWIHASYESAVLVQQILYLFGQTKFCSPRLLLLGLELRRALGSDSQRLQDLLDKTRTAQLEWSNTYRMPLKHIFRFCFRFWHFVNDNTKVCIVQFFFSLSFGVFFMALREFIYCASLLPLPLMAFCERHTSKCVGGLGVSIVCVVVLCVHLSNLSSLPPHPPPHHPPPSPSHPSLYHLPYLRTSETHPHTHTHTRVHTHAHTHTITHTLTHSLSLSLSHTHTHTLTHSLTHTLSHA
jgi:hypothetical protein